MASVNFEKLKTAQDVKAMLRHCDKEERMTTNHSNQQIDKKVTSKNEQFDDMGYKDSCRLYDERIAYLDSLEGANKRSDRVTCFGLEVPAPAYMSEDDEHGWFEKVYGLISEQYGEDNIIGLYTHYDEKHTYIDAETGKERTSRDHMHVYVIPEIDGKLNGKKFSSKRNMTKLNNSIQKMTQSDYGLDFMDGSKRKSKESVESLKRRSEQKKVECREAELKAQQELLNERENNTRVLQKEAENKLIEAEKALSEAEELKTVYRNKINNIDDKTKRALKYYNDAMTKRHAKAQRNIQNLNNQSEYGFE